MDKQKLLEELKVDTLLNIKQAEFFKTLPIDKLNFKSNDAQWSILECVEHLNRYGRFYIPEISQKIKNNKYPNSNEFKSGILGDYFAKSMQPKEKINKMKTFPSMNPKGSKLTMAVIDEFISQQNNMLDLLNQAQNVNLTKTKTNISISKWIKLRLGDTFRVVIFHNNRHILQAKKIKFQSFE
mgnify:FL=1